MCPKTFFSQELLRIFRFRLKTQLTVHLHLTTSRLHQTAISILLPELKLRSISQSHWNSLKTTAQLLLNLPIFLKASLVFWTGKRCCWIMYFQTSLFMLEEHLSKFQYMEYKIQTANLILELLQYQLSCKLTQSISSLTKEQTSHL